MSDSKIVDRDTVLSCRHDLANGTCSPATGTTDPGPEEDYEANLEGPPDPLDDRRRRRKTVALLQALKLGRLTPAREVDGPYWTELVFFVDDRDWRCVTVRDSAWCLRAGRRHQDVEGGRVPHPGRRKVLPLGWRPFTFKDLCLSQVNFK